MSSRKDVLDSLSAFKSARDAMLHADQDDFRHHLQRFARELEVNPLSKQIIEALPKFDASGWWSSHFPNEGRGPHRLDALNLPDSKDAQLAIFVEFVRSFVSANRKDLSVEGFGQAFGKHKLAEAWAIACSLILRPLAEEFNLRLRDAALMANPDVRELAGVPLNRIPSENELGIFLSHKSVNKELVRRYHRVLSTLGYQPWLDEEDINAGDILHRALVDGMDTSCAAVFFITSEFKDEKWIGKEVDLAVQRKVERDTKFQIITLVFDNANVPRPLQTYAYAHVQNDLDGLREIVRALPIELGPPRWRERVLSARGA